jgi:mannose-6-phosphate isomerase-like protein (cupin superfamily)
MVAGMTTNEQRTEAEAQVLQLGQRWADAERRGDAGAMEPLLADDFVLVGPLGFVLDKQQYLGSRRSGDLRHESFECEDVGVRVHGEAAVAVGTQAQRSTYQGRDASGRFRVTQFAVRRDGRWVLAGMHLSPIVQPAAAESQRPREPEILDVGQLRPGDSFTFRGVERGGVPVSFILDRSEPGRGPALHRHPYDELWIVDDGHATFTAGDRSLEAGPGSVVVVPGGTPHAFRNTGPTPMRMVCIHTRGRMETEWL